MVQPILCNFYSFLRGFLIDGRCVYFGTAFLYFSCSVLVMSTAQSSVINSVASSSLCVDSVTNTLQFLQFFKRLGTA